MRYLTDPSVIPPPFAVIVILEIHTNTLSTMLCCLIRICSSHLHEGTLAIHFPKSNLIDILKNQEPKRSSTCTS